MPEVVMPDVKHQGLVLPGGWKIWVPEISVEPSDPRVRDVVKVLGAQGYRRELLEAASVKLVAGFFERAWVARTKQIVGRRAKEYADQNFGSLEGFDPEAVARAWIPQSLGGDMRVSERTMKRLFLEMRRET